MLFNGYRGTTHPVSCNGTRKSISINSNAAENQNLCGVAVCVCDGLLSVCLGLECHGIELHLLEHGEQTVAAGRGEMLAKTDVLDEMEIGV